MSNKITPETAPVGARLLIQDRDPHFRRLREVTVLEWSPSANAVKLKDSNAGVIWKDLSSDDSIIVEMLPLLAVRDRYGHIHHPASITPITAEKWEAIRKARDKADAKVSQ